MRATDRLRSGGEVLDAAHWPVLRLLDRALAAHGRDTGYLVDAWLERAFEFAHARARVVSTLDPVELPLGVLVEASAEAVADVVMALHRDRLGVPEGLVDALASLLVCTPRAPGWPPERWPVPGRSSPHRPASGERRRGPLLVRPAGGCRRGARLRSGASLHERASRTR
jgi:hypothetical protein